MRLHVQKVSKYLGKGISKVVLSSIWLNAYTVNCQYSFSSKIAKQQIQTNFFSRQLHNYSIAILVMFGSFV